ncbi:FeoA domain-containing protein [Weissella confusa]|uniref:FeoA domain-containing protein n=1 Tax=Weissella confusa TaxID=1583 RepID=A0A923NJ64_WEICO|nr:FeoA domain-containing protein [Weissella confusa]
MFSKEIQIEAVSMYLKGVPPVEIRRKSNYNYEPDKLRTLRAANDGETVTLNSFTEDLELLQYVETVGVTLGSTWTIKERLPFDGPLVLTDGQRQTALRLIRSHRLIETFGATKLGLSISEAHFNADNLDHDADDEFVNALEKFLDYPKYSPHGLLIPDAVSKTQYLQTILELSGGDDDSKISNNQIADHLNVTPSSVSNMLAKLQEAGEVDVVPYYGVTLTEPGMSASKTSNLVVIPPVRYQQIKHIPYFIF